MSFYEDKVLIRENGENQNIIQNGAFCDKLALDPSRRVRYATRSLEASGVWEPRRLGRGPDALHSGLSCISRDILGVYVNS